MKKIALSALLVSATFLTGCATQTFTINGSGSMTPDKEMMQPFFISGLAQTKQLDAAQICGGTDKVAKVEAHLTFIDGLLGGLTMGIYTPRTAKVYCAR